METWIGNIDIRNISMLEEAKQTLGLNYVLGEKMGLGDGVKITLTFFPVFCESEEQGKALIKEYVKIACSKDKIKDLKNDSIMLYYFIENNEVGFV